MRRGRGRDVSAMEDGRRELRAWEGEAGMDCWRESLRGMVADDEADGDVGLGEEGKMVGVGGRFVRGR